MREIVAKKNIVLGGKYMLRSKNTEFKIPYYAEVTGINDRIITLKVKAKQSEMKDSFLSARPYVTSLRWRDYGRIEKLYVCDEKEMEEF